MAEREFEALVAEISSLLVGAQPQTLNQALQRALADIGETLDADRIVLGSAEERTGEMIARAHFRRTDPPFPDRLSISQRYPFLWQRLRGGHVLYMRDVQELGPEQALDRQHFQEVGITSQITAPVFVDGHLRYLLAVATVGRQKEWSEETVARVKVLAELLAITALRCEAEAIVRTSERQFRTFIEQAPVPIILVPSPDGDPIYFNPEFTRIFGYTRDDIRRPEDWWPMVYPDAAYRARRHSTWERTITRARETGDSQDNDEAEMRTKTGEIRFTQTRLTLIDGYRLNFINDLTDRRHAETALRLTQYAVDHNPVIIFRIDMDGRFVYANDAACTQFGYAPAQLLTLHFWDIARTLSADAWPLRAATLREQGCSAIETIYSRRSGETFPVEARTQFMECAGKQQFVVFADDITDRKAAQQAEYSYTRRIQKLAAELTRSEERQRRELAAVLHDEVGQNLFAATTQLLALRTSMPGSPAELDKALALLDQVTRDTRQLTFELCPPVLYQLGLMPALQRLADQFTARYGVACAVTGFTQGPNDLNVRGLAYQAVRELFNNTAKHAAAKHVTLHICEQNGQVYIDFTDDGKGFDCQSLQAAPGGFGLFHLRERIELLGGRMSIDAAPQQGCRVQLILPSSPPQSTE